MKVYVVNYIISHFLTHTRVYTIKKDMVFFKLLAFVNFIFENFELEAHLPDDSDCFVAIYRNSITNINSEVWRPRN